MSQNKKRKSDWNPLDHPSEYDLTFKTNWDHKKIERYLRLIIKNCDSLNYNSSNGDIHSFTIGFTWTTSFDKLKSRMGVLQDVVTISKAGQSSTPEELSEIEALEEEFSQKSEVEVEVPQAPTKIVKGKRFSRDKLDLAKKHLDFSE